MLDSLLHHRDGVLTQDLVLQPGQFGLGKVPSRLAPDTTTTSVCGFCATGCALTVHIKDGKAVNLTARSEYPVNLGMACPKGWEALSPLAADDRATTPLLRSGDGELEPVDWDGAMMTFTARFKKILAEHGPESVAFLSTGQIPTEEMAFLGALAKFGMGLIHGDGNTRQCMASAATAYKESFGFDAPPFTYQDFEESDVLVFVGANPCIAHPIMWQRVLRNPHAPDIIVIDPRKTETAMFAKEHLALAPKSDLTLLYGLANLIIEAGAIDQQFVGAHTNDFAAFAEFVKPYSLDRVASETGIPADQIQRTADAISQGKRVSFWWTMGVNQSHEATRTAQAIINIALMTGNIGRPGTGPNSITGQCNAMGSRLFSNTTSLLGGHDFTNPNHRQKIANLLEIDVSAIPDRPSLPYHKIIEGVAEGRIKGLWFIATNPGHSWIDQNAMREALGKLDFLVVQDMYHTTETAALADLVLPAAGWGEKEGTFINAERRIGRIRKVSPAPGQALADFAIFKLIAHYWGCGDMFADWQQPQDCFRSLTQISQGQPCDITAIDGYQMIDRAGGIQWPLPTENIASEEGKDSALPTQQRRLFADGGFFHPDKKARFIFDPPRPVAEPTNAEFPFILLTGRGTSSQWHTQTRTGKSAVLQKLYPAEIYCEINPTDAQRLGIAPESQITLRSCRDTIRVRAVLTPTVKPGQLFLPMHYAESNRLTKASFDPHSHQPSYKFSAVAVAK